MPIKRWLKSFASNKASSRFVLSLAVLLVGAVLALASLRLSRSSLLPAKADRHDVSRIYYAPMVEVCKTGALSLEARDFEGCAGTISLTEGRRPQAFKAVEIPTPDDNLAGNVPTMKLLLQQQGLLDLQRSLLDREPFVVGVRLPTTLLRENRVGVEPNVLVFDGFQDARVCLDGRCPMVVSKYDQYLQLLPLVAATPAKEDHFDVLFFAKDTLFALGPLLENGVYVTSQERLYTTKRLFPILMYGKVLFLATMFIGLFLMAFGFAAIWSEFLDYGAFCYLTASFAAFALASESALGRLAGWSIYDFYRFKSMTTVNLLASMIAFAMATNRTSPRKVFSTLLSGVLAGVVYVFAAIPEDSPQVVIKWGGVFDSQIRLGILVVPVAIILFGAVRCFGRFKDAKRTGPLSLELDFKRRTIEQALYSTFMLGIAFQIVADSSFFRAGFTSPTLFAPTTGILLFGIFAVIIYHSTTKLAKTHFRSDGMSEAVRLKGRMTTRTYRSWLSENRQGIMMQVDIKNSSVASSSLKSKIHQLMQSLNEAMRKSHSQLGYHWILAKKNGDEWIVILSAKHEDLSRDLAEVVEATRQDAYEWLGLVRAMAPECSLHVNIFALTSYTLGSGKWEVIDFASREANYLMKWAGKSARKESLTVGASFSLFSEAQLTEATATSRVSNLIAASAEANAESVLDADSMTLMLACLPWTSPDARKAAA